MKHVTKAVILGLFSSTLMAGGTHSHSHDNMKFSVGEPGKGTPDRIISVSMQDTMRFDFAPELGELQQGETIEFHLRNDGSVRHEFSVGNAEDQVRRAIMMQKNPAMKHNDPNTVSLLPGESATLAWKFMGTDTVVFACNIPGHFEVGMKHVQAIGAGNRETVALN
jgi:uncharacterized cupredoxin-like copper-binding protein